MFSIATVGHPWQTDTTPAFFTRPFKFRHRFTADLNADRGWVSDDQHDLKLLWTRMRNFVDQFGPSLHLKSARMSDGPVIFPKPPSSWSRTLFYKMCTHHYPYQHCPTKSTSLSSSNAIIVTSLKVEPGSNNPAVGIIEFLTEVTITITAQVRDLPWCGLSLPITITRPSSALSLRSYFQRRSLGNIPARLIFNVWWWYPFRLTVLSTLFGIEDGFPHHRDPIFW